MPLSGADSPLAARYAIALWDRFGGTLTMYGGVLPGGDGSSDSDFPPAVRVRVCNDPAFPVRILDFEYKLLICSRRLEVKLDRI